MARTKGADAVSRWGKVWSVRGEMSQFVSHHIHLSFVNMGGQSSHLHSTPTQAPSREPKKSPYHPFGSRNERTSFLEAMYGALPREVRDLIYAEMLDEEDTLYCLRLPQMSYEDRRSQPALMSHWIPLAQIGPQGSMLREELAEIFYERSRFCIVDPHIGSLDTFLDTDIFFATKVAPKRHIRNITLELGPLNQPDKEGDRWPSMLLNTNRRPVRYENMRRFPDRLQSLLLSLSAPPEICTVKIWFAVDVGWWEDVNGVRALFLKFFAEAMMREGMAKWRNVLVMDRAKMEIESLEREREEWRGVAGAEWGGYLGRYGDLVMGWFVESRGALGI